MSDGARTRLAIIFGGASTEHEISVRSALSVLSAADRERFEVLPFGVTRDGAWMRPAETLALLGTIREGAAHEVVGADGVGALSRPQALEALATADVAFPLVHGRTGEDGAMQGLFELAGLPYVGAGVAASAIGMDKELMKTLLARTGIPCVPYRLVRREDWEADPEGVARAVAELGYPLFAKPSNGGSSVGISKIHSREDLADAVTLALGHDRKALVEAGVSGREIECAVLGNAHPEASPLGEIRYQREFYDYAAKYEDTGTELIAPVELPEEQASEMRAMSVAAYQAIDCAGMARVDFFLEDDGRIWLNEINTIPGFTDVSMFPRLWNVTGLSYRDLITRLVELAFERHAEQHHVA